MAERTDPIAIGQLRLFRDFLLEYFGLMYKVINHEKMTTIEQFRVSELFNIIGYESGILAYIITELTQEDTVDVNGTPYNMWSVALRLPIDSAALQGVGFCIQAVNRALGQLARDIGSGKRDKETGELITVEEPHHIKQEPPKAFIAHGGRSGILDKLREFVEALGITPIIVELSPSRGMSVDDKVNKYIKDADCGIVLATKGGIVDTKGNKEKQHPRLNVIDELERLRAAFPEKTILLVERGVDLPSNVSGLTYEPFVGQSMDRAFTSIVRELVEFGTIEAVKPRKGVT